MSAPGAPETSVGVEALLPGVQPVLPSGFEPQDVIRCHVWRRALQNAETQRGRVRLGQPLVPAVAADDIFPPTPQ